MTGAGSSFAHRRRRRLRFAAFVAAAGAAAFGAVFAWRAADEALSPSPAPSSPAVPRSYVSASFVAAPAAPTSEPVPELEPEPDRASFADELARASRLPDAGEREAARDNLCAAWAETDPRAAFLHLAGEAAGLAGEAGAADRHRADQLFRRWAARDVSAAFDHAERQPPGARREVLFGLLALVVAEADPAEAALIAAQDMRPGPERAETVIAVLHQWARRDLPRAADWADSFPRGALRDRALDEIAGFLRDVPPVRSRE